ncbi:MAG TPA: peptide-methionine (R)-S-oxide reductase MsrB [Steroidobacteraceae bacterium]|nr:peptide-methionine (R)-S-oxide reductase MsrB [Steroidobacteraceae bacterium]
MSDRKPTADLTTGQWCMTLTPEQRRVLRERDTEPPRSSPLDKEYRGGIYRCVGCGTPLFESATKFNSGSGWPSFFAPLPGALGTHEDSSLGMRRTEVHCAKCAGHLGHVFPDGPEPTGLRYCINGVVLSFEPAE